MFLKLIHISFEKSPANKNMIKSVREANFPVKKSLFVINPSLPGGLAGVSFYVKSLIAGCQKWPG
jgi:hypothetical protein